MAYNKAREERKWKQWKEKEEEELRTLGMNEEAIQELMESDWREFKTERNYQRHRAEYEIGVTGQALSTIVRRFMAVRNFLEFLKDNDILAIECTALEIEKYAQKLQERQIQAKGYNERLSGIGHFFKFMEVRKYINRIPFRLEYYMQKVVNVHHDRSVEYDVYMEILKKLYRFPERLRCMFLHLWCIGLRASEVCVLKGNAYYRQGRDCWIFGRSDSLTCGKSAKKQFI